MVKQIHNQFDLQLNESDSLREQLTNFEHELDQACKKSLRKTRKYEIYRKLVKFSAKTRVS